MSEQPMPMFWHRRQEITLLLGLTQEDTVSIALARELLGEVDNLTAELLERHEAMKEYRAARSEAAAENARLRAALEETHRYALTIVGAAEAYGEADCAHLWSEVGAIADTALYPLAAAGTSATAGEE